MASSKKTGWIILGVLGVLFFLFLIFIYIVFTIFSDDIYAKDQIGVIEINGVIGDSKEPLEQLTKFSKNENIRAIILRIDSPGGSVAPSQEIYREVQKIKKKKPVVVSMGTLAASGGYYIACAASTIFANPGTITGSIGVLAQQVNLEKLKELTKIDIYTYKSGNLKDSGSPFRQQSKEDETLYKEIVTDIYEQFRAAVVDNRKISKEIVDSLQGKILTGNQAIKVKLIDQLGNFRDAVHFAAKLTQIKGEPHLVYPKKEGHDLFKKLLTTMTQELKALIQGEKYKVFKEMLMVH